MYFVLASGSPRRKELLKKIVPAFEVVVSDVDETSDKSLPHGKNAVFLALKKARAVLQSLEIGKNTDDGKNEKVIIAADTVVVLGKEVFNKPVDRQEAVNMLSMLWGKRHKVITGVALICQKSGQKPKEYTFFCVSHVIIGAISSKMGYNQGGRKSNAKRIDLRDTADWEQSTNNQGGRKSNAKRIDLRDTADWEQSTNNQGGRKSNAKQIDLRDTADWGQSTNNVITNYIDECKPFDKAGAYGIQELDGYMDYCFKGELDNIIGLPTRKLGRLLKKKGLIT